ncbi:MAG: UDP-N-acetylmuramoylalanine--D-glutamate ligase [Cellvibrionales bacterium UBA7375]|nr:MAG: UDP-N-acetylmuramoylalanine--D-glutamate ligase [Cellvibrionales bacterium UBA7375]
MSDIIVTNRKTAILGMGATGVSVASFLASRDMPFDFSDSRNEPPNIDLIKANHPQAEVSLGAFDADYLCRYDRLIVSPGISLDEPELVKAKAQGVELLGDFELFLEQAQAPVIAITGSNGKSTVTALLGKMAEDSGISVGIGGNIGTPMLDLLDESHTLYVIEVSSFQLELLNDARGAISCLLNISPDHLDRYKNLQQYHSAKHRIFRGASKVVINREDVLTRPLISIQIPMISFGLNQPDLGSFGILEGIKNGYLSYGIERLMRVDQVALKGSHNIANTLAALALGYSVDLPMEGMLDTLKTFKGLPHRCQTIAEVNSVSFINDSKATNVGATIAAIKGLGNRDSKNIILIAGGQAKGQEFSALASEIAASVKLTILIGENAEQFASILQDSSEYQFSDSLDGAVNQANQYADSGDTVLLSPACASFDMFDGFEHRGHCFKMAVEGLSKVQESIQ